MAKSSDPTKDPDFQKVVQTFLRTKPKPHKAKSKRKTGLKAKKAKKAEKP